MNPEHLFEGLSEKISALGTQLHKLEASLKDQQHNVSSAAKNQISELQVRYRALEEKLVSAKEIGGEVVDDVKSGVQLAVEDFKQTIDSISKRLS